MLPHAFHTSGLTKVIGLKPLERTSSAISDLIMNSVSNIRQNSINACWKQQQPCRNLVSDWSIVSTNRITSCEPPGKCVQIWNFYRAFFTLGNSNENSKMILSKNDHHSKKPSVKVDPWWPHCHIHGLLPHSHLIHVRAYVCMSVCRRRCVTCERYALNENEVNDGHWSTLVHSERCQSNWPFLDVVVL